jgi:putative SOS response-associated peptidase YedK
LIFLPIQDKDYIMCGRYKQTSPYPSLAEAFGIAEMPRFSPAGVLAPGMRAPVIRDGALCLMTWGFVPHWSKEDMKTRIINARQETLAEKPAFRGAKRCLVPANGFFEWDKSVKPSQPYQFHLAGDAPFAFAGLWDEWADPKTGEVRETFAIVTTAPVPLVATVHDRMPLILSSPDDLAAWLDMKNNAPSAPDLRMSPASFPANENRSDDRQMALF